MTPRSNARRSDGALPLERNVVAEVVPQAERYRRQVQAAAPAAPVGHRVVAAARGLVGIQHVHAVILPHPAPRTPHPAPPHPAPVIFPLTDKAVRFARRRRTRVVPPAAAEPSIGSQPCPSAASPCSPRGPRPLPVLRRRRADRALHRARPRRRDHRATSTATRACCRATRSRSRPRCAQRRAPAAPASAARPIGNSRVKLTNVADCVKRGLVQEGQDPLQVAAERLTARRRRRAAHHRRRRHQHDGRRPRGLPRTSTATSSPWSACPRPSTTTWCRSASRWAPGPRPSRARSSPGTSSPSTRRTRACSSCTRSWAGNCGWLTAATAEALPRVGRAAGVRAGYRRRAGAAGTCTPSTCPSCRFDIDAEAERLRGVMDEIGCVNLFVSEGAGRGRRSSPSSRRAARRCRATPFGHVKLDKVNPGAWFAKQFAELLGAEKTMVQKSRLLRPLRRRQRRATSR